jgi:hypothetical protein
MKEYDNYSSGLINSSIRAPARRCASISGAAAGAASRSTAARASLVGSGPAGCAAHLHALKLQLTNLELCRGARALLGKLQLTNLELRERALPLVAARARDSAPPPRASTPPPGASPAASSAPDVSSLLLRSFARASAATVGARRSRSAPSLTGRSSASKTVHLAPAWACSMRSCSACDLDVSSCVWAAEYSACSREERAPLHVLPPPRALPPPPLLTDAAPRTSRSPH